MANPKLLKDFLIYLTTIKGKSPLTRKEFEYDLRKFLQFQKALQFNIMNENLDSIDISDIDIEFIRNISLEDLYAYIEYCKEVRKNQAATRARRVVSVRSFFRYLKTRRLLENDPSEYLETPRRSKRVPVYLTPEESMELLTAAKHNSSRDYAMIVLLLNLGLRVSELVNLDVTSVRDRKVHIIGKGDKERIVFLNDMCVEAIEEYMIDRIEDKQGEALFTSSHGRRITRNRVGQIVNEVQKHTSIRDKKISPHKLRHTTATMLYRAGVDILTLKDILGHNSVSTTQIYTHVDSSAIEKAMALNPLNKK